MTWRRARLFAIVAGAAASCAQTQAPPAPTRFLFIGNSYTLQHDVPGLVAARLGDEADTETAMVADGGQVLERYVNDPRVTRRLAEIEWDVIVLQGHSRAAFDVERRAGFNRAVDWFSTQAAAEGAALLLVQTWPRRAGHGFYGRPAEDGVHHPPRSPSEMAERVEALYAAAAARVGARIAPVGRCWAAASDMNALYAEDGSHASPAGAALAADVIALTIRGADTGC